MDMEGGVEDLFKGRLQKIWKCVWSKDLKKHSAHISRQLAHITTRSGQVFPKVVDALEHYFMPDDYAGNVLNRLLETNAWTDFLEHALLFMQQIVSDQMQSTQELDECLNKVAAAHPSIRESKGYKALAEIARLAKDKD